ncbi:MAG TPA: hypothetical protein PLZ55_08435 [bacterium]|nr:hypothetical protein [bacterium]HPO08682.1 hypothetical protein [bacterium]HQP98554.1 hypothetical protein [bacterium]
MIQRRMKVGLVLLAMAMVVSNGWSQADRMRDFTARMVGDTGKYINIVLLLDEATSAKVDALCQKEGEAYMARMQEIGQATGDDRQAIMGKMQEEREKYAERIKTGLVGILSEEQIKSIEPILNGRVPSSYRAVEEGGRDALLWVLPSLGLTAEQKEKMVKVTVPYACGIHPFAGRSSRQQPLTDEEKGKIKEMTDKFSTDAGAILTAEQKEKWQTEADKLKEQWQKEREERRNR